ncbi:hypothetical protein [Hyalangium rubrum]|uniref:Restriction endonuclease n=1 Tax=Hyalangium rubrum TaxID=3103134 RepID=A0ABU5HAX2_9BACT|nr:hypothetical protein [Hyalangium sp. s54d21]MDY7230618.1 hypothetical protein [Hyalangium sp. s54d21]
MAKDKMEALETELESEFRIVSDAMKRIKGILAQHADGKSLKGDELVGWLGEIYGKMLLDGALVDDREEHDFVVSDGRRVSVKTRKGSNWKRSGSIPKIDGLDCPTNLMFVRLGDDYRVKSVWLYEWSELLHSGRFVSHKVRGVHRSFFFEVNEGKDLTKRIYWKG